MARVKLDMEGVAFVFRTELDVRITDINYGRHVGNDAMLGLLHEAGLTEGANNKPAEFVNERAFVG